MPFSVLIAVYAKESPEYLKESLASLLQQTLRPDEVVLVEDGVIGNGLSEVIESFRAQLNIVTVRLSRHSGLAGALNEGLKECTYELVARMDSDDVSMPNRFEKQIAFMQANPDISVSSATIEEYDENMNKLLYRRSLPLTHEDLYDLAKSRNPLNHVASVFRKQAVLNAGGYPEVYPEDYALWISMLQQGMKFANLPDTLICVRTGKQFLARRGIDMLIGELKIFRYMYDSSFISEFEYFKAVIQRFLLRMSPNIIKSFLYRHARK
jgi:glycosyltransferase involved in cell wall biosynthesis